MSRNPEQFKQVEIRNLDEHPFVCETRAKRSSRLPVLSMAVIRDGVVQCMTGGKRETCETNQKSCPHAEKGLVTELHHSDVHANVITIVGQILEHGTFDIDLHVDPESNLWSFYLEYGCALEPTQIASIQAMLNAQLSHLGGNWAIEVDDDDDSKLIITPPKIKAPTKWGKVPRRNRGGATTGKDRASFGPGSGAGSRVRRAGRRAEAIDLRQQLTTGGFEI